MSESESESYSLVINGSPVWFEKFGCGPRPILLIPGAIGTGRSDYLPQLEDEDALNMKKFTIIAVEAPGWGRSRPPARKYGAFVYENDADCFYEIMQHLGFERFSMIAWSDGTKSALTLATKYPDSVQGIVLLGTEILNRDKSHNWLKTIVDINSWGPTKISWYKRSYDSEEEIQDLWRKYVKSTEFLKLYFGNDMFKGKYHLIKCPVLVILGEKDMISDVEQCQHLVLNISDCRLQRFPKAGHDFHQKYPSVAKNLIENHLLSCKL